MTDKEKQSVLDAIDNEGFDYTFIHYSDFKDIKDRKFHQLRNNYIKATKALDDYLNKKLGV